MDQIIEALINNPVYLNHRTLFILTMGLFILIILMWIVIAIQHYILNNFERKKAGISDIYMRVCGG
jgi:hypothetical protein